MRKCPNAKNRTRYKIAANICKSLVSKNTEDLEGRILNEGNLNSFYNFVNSRLNYKSGIGPLKSNDGKFLTNSSEKSNALNSYFASVCTVDDGNFPEVKTTKTINIPHESLKFTPFNLKQIMYKLKASKSPGPDGIPPIFFKKLSRALCYPLVLLFDYIYSVNVLPTIWKHSFVTPLFKKGSRSDISNYRPISLTCVMCKIFESVIKKSLLTHLNNNEIISENQHGFLSGHSC